MTQHSAVVVRNTVSRLVRRARNAWVIGFLGAILLMVPSRVSADTIQIGLQQPGVSGGLITTVANGSGSASFAGPYGTFLLSGIVGAGNPPLTSGALEGSTSLNTSSSAAGNLKVYVTEMGMTTFTGIQQFVSSFTENGISPGWTVTESIYLDPSNTAYGLTTLLGTATFPPSPVSQPIITSLFADAGSGPYSLTTVYDITSNGGGSALSTAIVTVSEPASLSLLGVGFLLVGIALRKTLAKA